MDPESLKDQIIEMIKTIYDPEIPVSIYELGLIYTLEVTNEGHVTIKMTLTTPACPVAESLPLEVHEKVMSLEDVNEVDLQLVWDPPWTKDRMTDEARLALDMF
jgi:FeS assembly SUF system protein